MLSTAVRAMAFHLLLAAPVAAAQPPEDRVAPAEVVTEPGERITELESLVVSGAQPGPGLWKVSSGGNVLYILGTVSPLPRRMDWASTEVESVIAGSQAVIGAPAVTVDADIGFFRGMALVPAMLRARNNPGGRALRDVVPAELYARWTVLKARYMGRDRGVEKRRPVLAAQALFDAALRRSGLRSGGVVGPVVARARKAGDVPLVESTVRLEVDDPKTALRELNGSDLADIQCFEETLDRIEGDLEGMRARANAWAVGDIEGLRALPHVNHMATCQKALTGSGVARALGIDELPRRARDAWLANVEQALSRNASTFAMLPMHELLGGDGLLERLVARGYIVEAPAADAP